MDIRATSTFQHYDQEYDLPEADPLSEPPRAFELIPKADPKQRRRRRGRWSGLQVRLGRRAHHPPLLSILLANVQSLDNKVDDIRARVAFQRDIRDSNIQFHGNMALSGYAVGTATWILIASRQQELTSFREEKGWGVCFMTNYSRCNCYNIQELKSFCSPDNQ